MNNISDKLIEIRNEKNICLTGMTDEFFCLYISKYFREKSRDVIIVTSSLFEEKILIIKDFALYINFIFKFGVSQRINLIFWDVSNAS